jgi:hypothetical protein
VIGGSGVNVYVSKSFQYLCGACGKTFQKIMLVEFSMEQHKELSLMHIQQLFNTTESKLRHLW